MLMMKHSLSLAVVVAAMASSVIAYPAPTNDPNNIQVNVWTRQVAAAKAKAAQLNRPIMMAFVDTITCSRCTAWDNNVLSRQEWRDFLPQNPMILVFIDYAYSVNDFWLWGRPYSSGGIATPQIVILAPDGATKLDQFLASGSSGTIPGFLNRVRLQTSKYTGVGTIGLTAGAAAVSEGAGTHTVTVTRIGGSSGAQVFSYATANGTAVAGTDYTATTGTLSWASGDASTKSFTIPIINNDRWTTPTQRVFTVSITKTSGDATVGTTAQTVTIAEVSPYLPGTLGFTAASGSVREGTTYQGTVGRTAGAVGAAAATLSVPAGYTVSPSVLSWTDGDSSDKNFTVSGITATPGYDPRSFAVTLAITNGNATLGRSSQTVSVLDQVVTETFEDYIDGRDLYESLTQEDTLWFYNDGIDALRTEPLNGGARAALAWAAPQAGRLIFAWGHDGAGVGSLQLVVGEQTNLLSAASATNTVGVKSGDVVRWIATGTSGDFVARLKFLGWQALAPVAATGFAPAAESKFQIDAVRADTSRVDLVWQAGAGNPPLTVQRLYAGATATAMAEVVPATNAVVSGLNAVDLGIVDLTEAKGWVCWRVDTEIAADFGAAVAAGPVWRFAVIDLPSFKTNAPAAGSSVNAFLRTGTSIAVGADSATPVTYSAVGLPPGMSINPTTGVISGTTTYSSTYPVTVTARNSEGATTLSFVIATRPLPAYAVGVFSCALLLNGEGRLCGTMTLSASSKAALSAKILMGTLKTTARGSWSNGTTAGSFTAEMTSRLGNTLSLTLGPDGILTGSYAGATLIGRIPTTATALPFYGYYTALLEPKAVTVASPSVNNEPKGIGYLTLSVNTKGVAKYGGLLSDSTKVSGSASVLVFSGAELNGLGYEGLEPTRRYACVPLYNRLYSKRGEVNGLVWIDAGQSLASPYDNLVLVEQSFWNYPGRSVLMSGDGFVASFNAGEDAWALIGGYYARPQTSLASAYVNAMFEADDELIPVSASASSLSLPLGNALNASLKVKSSSGLISGKLYVGGTTRASYSGALVPLLKVGGGTYTVSDPAFLGYRLKRSYPVLIDQPAK